jgi:hypothetical protein
VIGLPSLLPFHWFQHGVLSCYIELFLGNALQSNGGCSTPGGEDGLAQEASAATSKVVIGVARHGASLDSPEARTQVLGMAANALIALAHHRSAQAPIER